MAKKKFLRKMNVKKTAQNYIYEITRGYPHSKPDAFAQFYLNKNSKQ